MTSTSQMQRVEPETVQVMKVAESKHVRQAADTKLSQSFFG